MSIPVEPLFDVYVGDGIDHRKNAATVRDQPLLAAEPGKYLADPLLAEAVNIAITVGQPLLVTGEPGCGKTRLAWSVADELKLGTPLAFYTQSTSRAKDLLYRYDAVGRFHGIQTDKTGEQEDVGKYIHYEALGKAIQAKERRVVLIDEIDKAPKDFPNDLLRELEQMTFAVPELPGDVTFSSTVRPIVIITSNTERQLPLPFLRRCVYHHIDFPSDDRLKQIVGQRLSDLQLPPDLITLAISQFVAVRKLPGLVKRPATSELLSWLYALSAKGVSKDDLNDLRRLPLRQLLIKDRDDIELLEPA